MQINVTGHHVQLTPALRDYAVEKLERIAKYGNNGITRVEVILDVEKLQQIAKATVHMTGTELHASSEAGDMYSAIDLLADKLNHQITKHKEKLKDHRDHRDHQ